MKKKVSSNELKTLREQLRTLKKEYRDISSRLKDIRLEYYSIRDRLEALRNVLGKEQGESCPALKRIQTKYGTYVWKCMAKNYKYNFWNKDGIYRAHCYCCKLSREQAKLAMFYNKVLHGKKKESWQ